MKIVNFLRRHKTIIIVIFLVKIGFIFALKKFIFNDPIAKHMQVPASKIENHLFK